MHVFVSVCVCMCAYHVYIYIYTHFKVFRWADLHASVQQKRVEGAVTKLLQFLQQCVYAVSRISRIWSL